jgi:uncharacterized protein YbjT (DUF2867 family)
MNLEDNELLVIGSSGHSAKYFFERLAKENYKNKIKCLLRTHSQIDHLKCYDLNLEFSYADFDDIDSLKTAMIGVKTLLNIVGIKLSKRIVRAGSEVGVNWFICVHTTGRYSKFESKSAKYIEIEDTLLREFPNLTILRPTMIYGSNRDKNMHKLVKYIHNHKFIPVFGSGKNLMSPVHAQDLGNAYYDVLQNRETTFGNQYNLSGKCDITYISILEETALALDKKVFFVRVPIWLCLFAVYLINLVFRSRFPILFEQVLRMKEDKVFSWDDAFTDFGFSPMSFKDGIRLEVDELIK